MPENVLNRGEAVEYFVYGFDDVSKHLMATLLYDVTFLL